MGFLRKKHMLSELSAEDLRKKPQRGFS